MVEVCIVRCGGGVKWGHEFFDRVNGLVCIIKINSTKGRH